MLLNSHISAYTKCLAEKVCSLVRSTWGTSQGEDKLGARDKILNTKVARWACAGQTFPLRLFLNQRIPKQFQKNQKFQKVAFLNQGFLKPRPSVF